MLLPLADVPRLYAAKPAGTIAVRHGEDLLTSDELELADQMPMAATQERSFA